MSGAVAGWRWRATAPATYRVGQRPVRSDPLESVRIPPTASDDLAQLVTEESPIVFAAHASPPPWTRRGTAARFQPFAMAATPAALAAIGAASDDPVPALFDRFGQAGHRLTVVQRGHRAHGQLRLDPVDGPAAVVLGVVPLHDVGGGSRGAQLTMELLDRGFHVAYVTRFGTWGGDDIGLRHVHPRLEQYDHDRFDPAAFAARLRSKERVAICELPEASYLSVVAGLQSEGFGVVYDLIDDWSDPALGLDWYRRSSEDDMIGAANGLVGSAASLVSRLEESGRNATLVANGVNERLFSGDLGDKPADLPVGKPLLGYHGSLYGDWFDWDSLEALAIAMPQAAVAVIGEARDVPAMPGNVHFLGPKPQHHLPPYVGRYDVGVIPFAVTSTTHAVSPLKTFEMLAMGVPVAAPPLQSLRGLDGVHTAESLVDAVAEALAAPRPDGVAAQVAHGWGRRLGDMLTSVGRTLPEKVEPPPRLEVRPAITYDDDARRLR